MSASAPMLLKFTNGETLNTVDRKTVKDIAKALGFNETQAVHYALARLREAVLPAYPANAPDLSAKAMRKIRAANKHNETDYKPTSTLFEGR